MVFYSDNSILSHILGGKMANRKVLLALVLVVFAAGWSFAQTETEMEIETLTTSEEAAETETAAEPETTAETRFAAMPKNTITVDIGPTIIGLGIGIAGTALGGGEGLSSSGFGIAASYERQLLEKLTVGGRFAYLGGGLGFADSTEDGSASLSMKISSFSLEAHTRFYPWARNFFLDGMLGFANLSIGFSGSVSYKEENTGISKKETIAFDASRGYFKLGAKIGWRIDFGKQGGFIFEPSFGWYGGIGFGDTLGAKLVDDVKKTIGAEDIEVDLTDVDPAFKYLENLIFIGGPRLALSFGWRF
jgi:hypothetical protein